MALEKEHYVSCNKYCEIMVVLCAKVPPLLTIWVLYRTHTIWLLCCTHTIWFLFVKRGLDYDGNKDEDNKFLAVYSSDYINHNSQTEINKRVVIIVGWVSL
jgi:hypothetical protein